jgi:hypothetical protein
MRFRTALLISAFLSAGAHAQEGSDVPAPDAPATQAIPTAAPPAETPRPSTDVKPNAPAETGGDYEIDYEEEDEGGAATEEGDAESEPAHPVKHGKTTPVPKKAPVAPRAAAPKSAANDRSAPTSQGTRSKNRFAPLLKSDAKSVYKKNGKSLDVDTD